MRRDNVKQSIYLILILVALVVSSRAMAGGPFAVDTMNDSGVALRWENDTLSWYLDPGPLSNGVDNATGKTWVEDQLDKWSGVTLKNENGEDVTTVVFKSSYKGDLAEDVTKDNYQDYVNTTSGRTAVIFDSDGEITADLMGEENKNKVVGLSAPLLSDSSGLYITKGFALFNGYILDQGILAPDASVEEDLFQATILHELGHLINLDHSQVNNSAAVQCANSGTTYERNGSCEGGQYIPTMYPELLTTMQGLLTRDDKVTISWIYPSSNFTNGFCTITGEVFDVEGDGLKGVNVIAQRADEGDEMLMVDARSFVSGAMTSGCDGPATYYLHGIVPNHKYQVIYEALNSEYTGASGFEPLDDPPSDFESGGINGKSDETTVSCSEGGETVEMASATVGATNPCTGGGGGGGDDGGGGNDPSGGSSSTCSLVPAHGCDAAGALLSVIFMIAASMVVRRARSNA
jgi:hypothetical protein